MTKKEENHNNKNQSSPTTFSCFLPALPSLFFTPPLTFSHHLSRDMVRFLVKPCLEKYPMAKLSAYVWKCDRSSRMATILSSFISRLPYPWTCFFRTNGGGAVKGH